MKTLSTLVFAAITAVSVNTQASQEVWSQEYEEWVSPSLFTAVAQPDTPVTTAAPNKLVWDEGYEEWIRAGVLNQIPKQNLASILSDIENNPPAAGSFANNPYLGYFDDEALN